MKRLLGSGMAIAIALLGAGVATAGDYHAGSDLVCSDCHVMHFSQQHGYNSDGSGAIPSMGTGPNAKLLRHPVNDLCLSCHDGDATAPDVLFAQTGSVVRQAGALNMSGFGEAATGHTLGSTDAAPGSNPAWNNADGLACSDCHEQHGNTNYRNLRTDPGNSTGQTVTYAVGTQNLTADVYETAAADYSVDAVFFNEPDVTGSAYADWCKGCHTDFHGAQGGSEVGGTGGTDWLRHPAAAANIGGVGGSHSDDAIYGLLTNKVKVMNPAGDWDGPDYSTSTPSCFSCHKAHGNQNAFGLIFMSGTGTVGENGDDGTSARDLCGQCHSQGA